LERITLKYNQIIKENQRVNNENTVLKQENQRLTIENREVELL